METENRLQLCNLRRIPLGRIPPTEESDHGFNAQKRLQRQNLQHSVPGQELEGLALLLRNFQGSLFRGSIGVRPVVGGGEGFGSQLALQTEEEENVNCRR